MTEALYKIVASVADAIKVQPLPIVLLIFNIVVFAIIYLAVQDNYERQARLIEQLVAVCLKR